MLAETSLPVKVRDLPAPHPAVAAAYEQVKREAVWMIAGAVWFAVAATVLFVGIVVLS